MMTHKELEGYILAFDNVWLDFPFGEDKYVYKVGDKQKGEGEMFALIDKDSKPVRLSLKCDPVLAESLRKEYETILPGLNLNKKYWNTIICTGQVSQQQLTDLIRLSYRIVTETDLTQ